MINYRQAEPFDVELTFTIKKRASQALVAQIWGWDDAFQLAYHQKQFEPSKMQLICMDNLEIGLIVVSEKENQLFLENLLIDPTFQGMGIGTEVLTALITKAKQANKGIELQVLKINERAKKLYESLNFVVFNETELHYQMRYTGLST